MADIAASQLRMLHDRVLIRPDPPEETAGRIIVPEWVRDKHHAEKLRVTGIVVSVGPGMPCKGGEDEFATRRWPMPDVVGKRVIFYPHFVEKVELEGVLHLIVRDDNIDAVLE